MRAIKGGQPRQHQAIKRLRQRAYGGMLIEGDCTAVLPALKHGLSNAVSCIYIDPPYRNGDVYGGYKDNASHTEWTRLMSAVIASFDDLLEESGSVWISIDDAEMAHLKILCDAMLGQQRYVATIVWEHRLSRENRSAFSHNHEYILVYAKNPIKFKAKRHKIYCESLKRQYKNPDDDPRGSWQSVTATAQGGHAARSQFYEIVSPITGKIHTPPQGRCWVYNQDRMLHEIEEGRIWFGADGNGVPRIKKYLSDAALEIVPSTLWRAEEVGTTQKAKREVLKLTEKGRAPFDTPKPEALLRRIMEIATDESDLVLDAFLGSGTTSAVAYMMGRRFIGIECNRETMRLAKKRIDLAVPDSPDYEVPPSLRYGSDDVHLIEKIVLDYSIENSEQESVDYTFFDFED